ncbi:hypothetical protein BD408DRAFT_382581 [Parasitella parasitica]|nr:hypothetical protein BD408DRAFT_382581 [Parasitella parasitica]
MGQEEVDLQTHDICSQINLLSSIQHQERELSKLARQLESEKDRDRYSKVIEMSKVIQSKLDSLQQEKKRSDFDVRIVKTMDRKSSMWSLQQYNYRSNSSSCYSQSSSSDNTTIATNNGGSQCGDDLMPIVLLSDAPARYHTYNGHTYRIIDRVTSLQFKSDSLPAINSRRPSSPDSLFDHKTFHVKPAFRKKQISFSPLPPKHNSVSLDDSEDDDEEEITQSATIHVAVRRDASLFKIEKAVSKETMTPIESSSIKSDTIGQNAVKLLPPDNKKPSSDAGLLTPPSSPQPQSQFDREISSEADLDLTLQPHIIHVHKKAHSSIKGLLKRSYQLNQYTITKTNSITLPPPSPSFSSFLLYKTYDSITGKQKLLLKVVIASLTIKASEEQKRFGFTFMIPHQSQQQQQQHHHHHQDDAKFALAPDSLVKEALATWINYQNEQQQQQQQQQQEEEMKGTPCLPSLSKADEILREGRKLYIVYDATLLLHQM